MRFLVLGVNSDASVKRLGQTPDRPINLEKNRAYCFGGSWLHPI